LKNVSNFSSGHRAYQPPSSSARLPLSSRTTSSPNST